MSLPGDESGSAPGVQSGSPGNSGATDTAPRAAMPVPPTRRFLWWRRAPFGDHGLTALAGLPKRWILGSAVLGLLALVALLSALLTSSVLAGLGQHNSASLLAPGGPPSTSFGLVPTATYSLAPNATATANPNTVIFAPTATPRSAPTPPPAHLVVTQSPSSGIFACAGSGPANYPSFRLSNTGSWTLFWSATTSNSHVKPSPSSARLAAHSSQTVLLSGFVRGGSLVVSFTSNGGSVSFKIMCGRKA
jgi:hypothetical protein